MSDWKDRVEAAHSMVDDLCHQRRKWIMSIPAKTDYDPDLVISHGLTAATREIARLEAENDVLRRAAIDPSMRGVPGSIDDANDRMEKAEDAVATHEATIRRLRGALEPLAERMEAIPDADECECPAEGHHCGRHAASAELEQARAALAEEAKPCEVCGEVIFWSSVCCSECGRDVCVECQATHYVRVCIECAEIGDADEARP